VLVQFDKVRESSTVSSVQAVGLDASSAASRTDVIIIAASAILLLTGLQWLALRPTEKEAVHNFSPLYSKTGKTYRLTSDDGPHPRLIGFDPALMYLGGVGWADAGFLSQETANWSQAGNGMVRIRTLWASCAHIPF
jgi:hypothetical protein